MGETRTYSDRRQLRQKRVEVGSMCKKGKHSKCFVQECDCKKSDGSWCHERPEWEEEA